MGKSNRTSVSRTIEAAQENPAPVHNGDDRSHVTDDADRQRAPVMDWRKVILWRDGTDGRRYKVRSVQEIATAMMEWRDNRRLPPGYHFNGWKMVFTTEGMDTLSTDHVHIHVFTVRWFFNDNGYVSPVYDVREIYAIASYLKENGKLPRGIQPWSFSVDFKGVDEGAKGATATVGEMIQVKGKLRFSLDD